MSVQTNDLERFSAAFDGIQPYAGEPPKGYYPDWIGALTAAEFRAYQGMDANAVGGSHVATRLPTLADGEGWFEALSQVEAAREARGNYVMVSLGACYGAPAVGSYLALKALNPMPAKLVAVEPEPTNLAWIARHFRDNGIDPADHWLVGAAIGASNAPTLFPVGAPGSGAQNSVATNGRRSRELYARRLTASAGRARKALESLLRENRIGLRRDLISGVERDEHPSLSSLFYAGRQRLRRWASERVRGGRVDPSRLTEEKEFFLADLRFVSTVTLGDLLSPFERVDYVESDIQQSEMVVFPPWIGVLNRKVRRVHIGTHGKDVHASLSALFRAEGWEMVFDYPPGTHYQSAAGAFTLNDGVLMALNPRLEPQ